MTFEQGGIRTFSLDTPVETRDLGFCGFVQRTAIFRPERVGGGGEDQFYPESPRKGY